MNQETIEHNLNLAEKVLEKNKGADIGFILNDIQSTTHPSFTKAYILSIILAPFGIYYFFKYLFIDDYKKQAILCLLLTAIVFFLEIVFFSGIIESFSMSGNSINNGSSLQNLGL